jgi:mycothiol maleylpyruvate isomerase-like protein
MSESHAAAYEATRARVRAVVEAADAAALDRVVPATPEWRARDVLAHMVGVTDDVVHGRLEGLASDAWTRAQVDARRAVPPARLLDEWDEHAARFGELLGAAPAEIAGQALFDAATHEHDLRNALGAPGARDSDAVECGWDWIVDARTRAGAPAICFATEAGERLSGAGERAARIEATRFELFRAVSGRRTETEIRAYRWDREPDPALLLGAEIFSFAARPLGE